MAQRHLTSSDLSALSNICLVAADRYAEYATAWRQAAEAGEQAETMEATLFPSGPAALRLAEQFDRQAGDARDFANLFMTANPVSVVHDEEEIG